MKKLIILLLILCANVNAQNDFLLKSYDRPIIETTINGNDCYLLIDTGSSLNIVDFSQLDDLGIKRRFKIGDTIGDYLHTFLSNSLLRSSKIFIIHMC